MWVRFLEPYQYRPSLRVSVHYKAGHVYNVPTLCAQAAIAEGKAEKMKKTNRSAKVETDA